MKWAFWTFMALYAGALFLFLVGTFGWFGEDRDPLSGVFLMPLGLPWNLLADRLGMPGLAAGLLAPMINAVIFFWLWKR
ncbi:hypothetical protein [Novosphingobium malaysiense]|uniref:Uncharacterized protein n=1 Tax=Novosphingobium malaysiense TaxID=1348853 RepID=A0A0B1ZR17_9SPHN|nr:hypothetical protein [Novosphingobium malaysiense]KHK93041.1 hypothetical protein LK12_01305 [Novosphingobium malaysiense]